MTVQNRSVIAPRRIATYDEVAPLYDRWKWQEFWRRNEAPVVRELLAHEPIVDSALDVGAGTGALTAILRERALAVTAVDASAPMLRELRRRHPGVAAVRADAQALPFADAAFSRVGASRLLSHIDDPLDLLRECARVMRPGSLLVVTELHPQFEYDETTFGLGNAACSAPFTPTRHSLTEIERVATEAGYGIESLRTFLPADLRWLPARGTFATLDANTGPVFYVAALRRPPL